MVRRVLNAVKYTTLPSRSDLAGTHIKFCFWFHQSGQVCTIHKEDDAIDGREVVFPHSAGCLNQHTNKQEQTLRSALFDFSVTSVKYHTVNMLVVRRDRLWHVNKNIPCAWPPRSKVVKVMPAIVNSSEAREWKEKLSGTNLKSQTAQKSLTHNNWVNISNQTFVLLNQTAVVCLKMAR